MVGSYRLGGTSGLSILRDEYMAASDFDNR
jgi:hypothetical protein